MSEILAHALVFIAEFIDSIAGGGGLITVPVFSLLVGPGAPAIGTNKIVGLVAAATALIVYMRKGHLQWRGSGWFIAALGIGTISGAKLTFYVPVELFKWLLTLICPAILYVTLKRDSFITRATGAAADSTPGTGRSRPRTLILLGFLCGLYDGAFGPGGGTFMFLSLAGWGGFPLVAAIATSKLANTLSAGASLVMFAWDGAVVWKVGLTLLPASLAGALVGSLFASAKAKHIVRPVLAVVVILLLIRIWWAE